MCFNTQHIPISSSWAWCRQHGPLPPTFARGNCSNGDSKVFSLRTPTTYIKKSFVQKDTWNLHPRWETTSSLEQLAAILLTFEFTLKPNPYARTLTACSTTRGKLLPIKIHNHAPYVATGHAQFLPDYIFVCVCVMAQGYPCEKWGTVSLHLLRLTAFRSGKWIAPMCTRSDRSCKWRGRVRNHEILGRFRDTSKFGWSVKSDILCSCGLCTCVHSNE